MARETDAESLDDPALRHWLLHYRSLVEAADPALLQGAPPEEASLALCGSDGRALTWSQLRRRAAWRDAALVFLGDGQSGAKLLGQDGDPLLISHVLNCAAVSGVRGDVLKQALSPELRPIAACPETATERGRHLPLVARGRTVGVLEIYGAEQLSTVTQDALASLAAHAISALENAHLYREVGDREQRLQDALRRLLVAQEEERRRVAYELHDGLAQVAAATHLSLQTLASQYRPRSERTRQQLDRSVDLAQRVVREARQVIAGLRPTVLDDFGLERALRLHVQELAAEGCLIDFQAELGEDRLPGPIETVLYRIVQEALTNVRKHARVQAARVRLRRDGGIVELLVTDAGAGFRPFGSPADIGPGQHVGLVGMRERAALVGGDCVVWSEPGQGTEVLVRIPLPSTTAHDAAPRGVPAHGR